MRRGGVGPALNAALIGGSFARHQRGVPLSAALLAMNEATRRDHRM